MAVPYKESDQSKKGQIEQMFDNISPNYDLLNHLLSVNIDKLWRKRTIRKLAAHHPKAILDVATGTGDFALAAARMGGVRITGIDISEGMLEVARTKIKKKKLEQRITFLKADSENLPFDDHVFDAVIVGFGVRNFENLEQGLAEINRVLKPGGVFYVLEFSKPTKSPFRQLYHWYFTKVLPAIGRLISKDHHAYSYLPESVHEFPDGERFEGILKGLGFSKTAFYPQTFGIATIYEAFKP